MHCWFKYWPTFTKWTSYIILIIIFNHFHRYTASDATGYVADVRYEGTIKPLPSVPRPVVVPAPEARRTSGGRPVEVPTSSLRPRPIQKRKTQSLANQEQRNKHKQKQAKKQQQGSIQFQEEDGWTQVPTFGFQSQE